ncbi:hypothetical protein TNIN_375822 [Trichonephila inaurata madagascariensis]|uniref:Uncharacterized protein n=1 Tax=Trichonephila inaurata madagascariensis TaxID=2747483 RepID=A0A8X6WWS2_9ARAC|nr:hypothetical protein TNIN_375822 [Trichonephila inaurata madagascariensis]
MVHKTPFANPFETPTNAFANANGGGLGGNPFNFGGGFNPVPLGGEFNPLPFDNFFNPRFIGNNGNGPQQISPDPVSGNYL